MEKREIEKSGLTIDRDTQIQVVLNSAGEEGDTVRLSRVFHTMKLKWRVYAWVLVLCIVVGACAPLVLYQFTRQPLTVSSVVTLKYDVADERGQMNPVEDLTAPDGSELDLNQITSSYVVQNAMDGMTLSKSISLPELRSNVVIERILSAESRRQQEVAASMVQDRNTGAYTAVQGLELIYENTFVVSLTNGFGEDRIELPEDELRLLLDRILSAYNDYLMTSYADIRLPDDEIAAIDVEGIDLLESLDQLRTAVDNLYLYCDETSDRVKAYRSWRTGRSLLDWMETLEMVRDVNVEYLYSYVYINSIVKDRDTMITNYQYQLRDKQAKLDVVNENIDTMDEILKQYKNDEIYVSMQESNSTRSTKTTTDYYNSMILQQAENYEQAEKLETSIADLTGKLESLNASASTASYESETIATAEEELENAVDTTHAVYEAINAHMQEIMDQPFFTTYAEHSASLGEELGFLRATFKQIIIGMAAGAVIACGLWLLSGLAPEFRHKEENEEKASDADAEESGEGVAEA